MSGRSIFLPGSDHFHHRLIKIGFSQKAALAILLLASCVGASIGIALNAMNDVVSITLFLIVLVLLPSVLSFEEKKQEMER